MNTVYDYFIDYAHHKLVDRCDAVTDAWQDGVKAYLDEIGLEDCGGETAEPIALREWRRFSLMTPQTLYDFFDCFRQRAALQALATECNLLAIGKLRFGKVIGEEEYRGKMQTLYDIAAPIAGESRFRSWMDALLADAALSLRCARGLTNDVNEQVATEMLFGDDA